MYTQHPKIAIIDRNTLAAIGLKQILQNVMPIIEVEAFSSFEALLDNDVDSFFHYFVSMNVVLEHRQFFLDKNKKTIVLASSDSPENKLSDFHCISINVSEEELVLSILRMEQHAHAHGKNLPPMPKSIQEKMLSDREIEVLSLIAQGRINKEIADRLCISLTTVISHRKNIIDKLGIKTVSALTIYAVMHGYVDINKI